jgi:hypothetical protein
MRRIEAIERWQREALPSVAASFAPVIADLQEKDVALADLIATQTVSDSAWGEATAFAVPAATSPAEIASCTITVPAGYTRMRFTVIGTCRVKNDSGATQYIYLGPRRRMPGGAVYGGHMQQATLANGFSGTLMAAYIFAVDVTPGDVVEFYMVISASAALAADATVNSARTEVTVDLTR